MNNKFTILQAALINKCPNCDHDLLDDHNQTELIIWSDINKDCITHFQFPYCDEEFLRIY